MNTQEIIIIVLFLSFPIRATIVSATERSVIRPLAGNLFTGWAVSGIEMAQARFGLLCGTAGTCVVMLREPVKRSHLKTQSTDAQRRGGLTHSSVEGSVMGLESRSKVVQPLGGNLCHGSGQPTLWNRP